tara:strand:- start:1531 stop:1683 length:153 start_codon:yes stop_codon:yes gene_type:complete
MKFEKLDTTEVPKQRLSNTGTIVSDNTNMFTTINRGHTRFATNDTQMEFG